MRLMSNQVIHKTVVVGPLQCNCAILICPKTLEAVIIDPGDEPEKIIRNLDSGVKVKYLLHTHAHFDHIGGTEGVKTATHGTVCLHRDDETIYKNLPMQGRMFGMTFSEAPPIEKYITDNEELIFGAHKLEVIHTPGHSPGSICVKLKGGEERVFSGDTLFRQSVGRSDLWGGDHSLLIRSIKSRLMVLDGDIKVFPGHGPATRIGEEKLKNPFL
ncbi:MAG: MBL fold metallo-hydrolase [Deltaproteobacteria bacterium]|nr:MBL fold metallo-hydrolase [Deltaproteobacteria bacterium]